MVLAAEILIDFLNHDILFTIHLVLHPLIFIAEKSQYIKYYKQMIILPDKLFASIFQLYYYIMIIYSNIYHDLTMTLSRHHKLSSQICDSDEIIITSYLYIPREHPTVRI